MCSSDLTTKAADRFTKMAPLIARVAAGIEGAVALAAARTGGERHVRWETTPDCALDVAHVVLPPETARSFSMMIERLRAMGYDEPDRRYLVWFDGPAYCGTGLVVPDDPAAPSRPDDTAPLWARVDRGCWGRMELHELLHLLGAVQPDAPHGTAAFHCTDGLDPMCGAAGAGDGTSRCGSADALIPDCGGDDYFAAAPAPGT